MATKIVTKNSSTASAVPTASDLVQGELAVNVADKRLFTEDNGGSIVELGTNPSTIDINAGSIDGTAIGASSASTGAFTTLTATGLDVTGTATMDGLTVANTGTPTITIQDQDGTNQRAFLKHGAGNTTVTTQNGTSHGQFQVLSYNGTSTINRIDVSSGGDVSFYEDTGTTAKLFWDASAESLGIGTSSPDTQLTLYKASTNADVDYAKIRMDSWGGSTGKLKSIVWDDAGSSVAGIGAEYDGAKTNIHFHSQYNGGFKGTADRTMSIMGNGNVGIGTSSPSSYYSTTLVVDAPDEDGITVVSPTTGTGYLMFADGTSGNERYRGYINYGHANDDMQFATSGLTRMRIDSSGNLLVGTTVANPAGSNSVGVGISSGSYGGFIGVTRDGNTPVEINRKTSDGNLITLRKDGTSVGSIRSISGDSIGIGTGDAGLRFVPWSNKIQPVDMDNGLNSDGLTTLGDTNKRFKDLYLSGGVYAGDYASFVQGGGGDLFITNTKSSADLSITSGRTLIFGANGSEKARIDSSGNLLVGTTSTPNGGHVLKIASGTVSTVETDVTTVINMIVFRNGNGNVGTIQTNGSTTTYNTSSDQRLKENIADADDAGSKVDAIQVRKFDWKADGSHQDYGMIAQELQTVAPEAVTGDADSEEMMGVDYSKLVPMLIKEIQSLRNRVAQLEE